MDSESSCKIIDEFDPFDFLRESLEYANERIAELEAENRMLKEKLHQTKCFSNKFTEFDCDD